MSGRGFWGFNIRAGTQLHRTDRVTGVVQEREGGVYEGQEQLRVFKLFRRKSVYQFNQHNFKPAASH